jgi:hypothetical protein
MFDLLQFASQRRAWIAAGVAITSFVVSNIVKIHIDEKIADYKAISEKAKSFVTEGTNRLSMQIEHALLSEMTLLQAMNNLISEKVLKDQTGTNTNMRFIFGENSNTEYLYKTSDNFPELPAEIFNATLPAKLTKSFVQIKDFQQGKEFHTREWMRQCITRGQRRPDQQTQNVLNAYDGSFILEYKPDPGNIFDAYTNVQALIMGARYAEAAAAFDTTMGPSELSAEQFIRTHPLMNRTIQSCIRPSIQGYLRNLDNLVF